MVSKQEILGQKIMKRIHIHDKDQGGILSLTTGSQGSAKTSVLLSFAEYILKHHSTEKIFWSECYKAPLQIVKLGKGKYRFFVKNDVDIIFRDRDNKLKPTKIPITRFKDYDDLYKKAKMGKVNVVFFGNRLYWMEFLDYLRSVGEWVHIFIDEFGEVCPAYASGKSWKKIGYFSEDVLKDIRKCMMNVHVNTQSVTNIDHRARSKIMLKIFLPGAISDKHSRVTQAAIDNLKRDPIHGNPAYLDIRGEFGVVTFKDIYKPIKGFHIDAICNGGEREMSFILSFNGDKT